MESDQSVSCSASTMSPAVDNAGASYHHLNTELTSAPSSRSRHQRPPTVQPPNRGSSTSSSFAIPAQTYNLSSDSRQDASLVNTSATPVNSPTTPSIHNVPSSPLESLSLSTSAPAISNHGSINLNNPRPHRTSTQVFHNTSDLAAHYGIPRFLPPAPRTTPRSVPALEKGIETPEQDFLSLRSNYLAMLSEQPADNPTASDFATPGPTTAPETMETVQAIIDAFGGEDAFGASTEFRSAPDQFMTSPFESPPDDFLQTPAGSDFFKSPVVDFGESDFDLALFNGFGFENKEEEPPMTPAFKDSSAFDHLYLMSPPQTPALDPSSLFEPQAEISSACPRQSSTPPPPPRRKATATGTRKDITPDALVDIDAPTQARTYVTPSATSRKELPAIFARKRARAVAFDDDDELDDDLYTLPPNPTEAQLIAAKRRQNTIAARRSRKRKLEYQRELEDTNKQLMQEADRWKARALTCEALLKHHGLPVPQYDL